MLGKWLSATSEVLHDVIRLLMLTRPSQREDRTSDNRSDLDFDGR